MEGGAEGGLDPVGEARRFVAAQRNYFDTIDIRAEALSAEIADMGGAQAWLKARGTRVRFLPREVMGGAMRRYDRHNEQLLIDETLARPTRAYQLAIHLAYTAMRAEISAVVRGADLSSDTARVLVRRALAGYGAAALLMPYGEFAGAVEALRYDIEALSRQFDTSFEQTAHRLTTLGRPGMARVPFFFIRVDAAGNVSKRLDGAGFPFAAHGGGCPLWNVHSVFRTPRRGGDPVAGAARWRALLLDRAQRDGGGRGPCQSPDHARYCPHLRGGTRAAAGLCRWPRSRTDRADADRGHLFAVPPRAMRRPRRAADRPRYPAR